MDGHGPMSDSPFTRCVSCREWWPCTTRRNEPAAGELEPDDDRRARLLAEARRVLKGDE